MTERSTDNIGFYIKKINDTLEKRLNHDLQPFGITSSQMLFLMTLMPAEQLPMKELQCRLHVAQPTIAGITARLVNKSLIVVTVDQVDHRNKLVQITSAGQQLCQQLQRQQGAADAKITASLTETEYQQLRQLLRKIFASIE
jgi:DNA-binding MarR family transcriptional regulator